MQYLDRLADQHPRRLKNGSSIFVPYIHRLYQTHDQNDFLRLGNDIVVPISLAKLGAVSVGIAAGPVGRKQRSVRYEGGKLKHSCRTLDHLNNHTGLVEI